MNDLIHEILINDYVRYVVTITKKDPVFANFTVHEISRWNGTDKSYDINVAEQVMEGFIKWDGCSHVTFGEKCTYLHLCGKAHWNDFITMLPQVYSYVTSQIEKYDAKVGGE